MIERPSIAVREWINLHISIATVRPSAEIRQLGVEEIKAEEQEEEELQPTARKKVKKFRSTPPTKLYQYILAILKAGRILLFNGKNTSFPYPLRLIDRVCTLSYVYLTLVAIEIS